MFPTERKSMVQPEQCNQAVPGGRRAPPLKLLGFKPGQRQVRGAAGPQPVSLRWPTEGRTRQLRELHPLHLNSGGLPLHGRHRQGWVAAGPLLQEPFAGPPLRDAVQDPLCRAPRRRCPGGSQAAPQLSVRGTDTAAEAPCKAPGVLGSSPSINRG